MRYRSLFVVLTLTNVTSACSAHRLADNTGMPRSNLNAGSASYFTVDASQIRTAGGQTALDGIYLLPAYSSARASLMLRTDDREPVTYLDGVRLAYLSDLARVGVIEVLRMYYMDGPSAELRWGMDHSAGAIVVETVRGR